MSMQLLIARIKEKSRAFLSDSGEEDSDAKSCSGVR
jgi:hypothetical protein